MKNSSNSATTPSTGLPSATPAVLLSGGIGASAAAARHLREQAQPAFQQALKALEEEQQQENENSGAGAASGSPLPPLAHPTPPDESETKRAAGLRPLPPPLDLGGSGAAALPPLDLGASAPAAAPAAASASALHTLRVTPPPLPPPGPVPGTILGALQRPPEAVNTQQNATETHSRSCPTTKRNSITQPSSRGP